MSTPPRNLVGGELVDSVGGGTRGILNPATGDVLAVVPDGSEADVERAVAAAREARIPFRDTTPSRRQELLPALAEIVDRHADELAALESANVGKAALAGCGGAADLRRRAPLLRGRPLRR